MPKCPTCSGPVDLGTASSPPFCSDRCRWIDLGRWLDEAQALPLPRLVAEEEDAEAAGNDAGRPPADPEE